MMMKELHTLLALANVLTIHSSLECGHGLVVMKMDDVLERMMVKQCAR